MHCIHYRDAIQEMADGTLGPIRRAELQTHLDHCKACRELAADLRKIREAAAALDHQAPPAHVWMQIAGRLRQEGRVSSPAPRPRQYALLALAAGLLLSVGASLWVLVPRDHSSTSPVQTQGPADGGGNSERGTTVQSITDDLRVAEQHYQSAITKLEQAAQTDDGPLDPQTAAVLQKNLVVIDQAIAESRTALQTEPQNRPARDSLFDALRRKVTLLQDTIALMNEMRKGNSAGAAQVVDGSKS